MAWWNNCIAKTLLCVLTLAQACRKSSMTWHADVRRAFVQERLLLLPGQDSPSNSSNPSNPNSSNSRTSSSQRAKRPKRLFAKEAWWDVEDELAESKAANLSLRPLYEGVLGVPDAEFLFLRVLGLRKRCSRADIAHRLKASMNCPGPLSNWAEGIDITDLEELEDIQTSSYFRPPDWRVPERQTQESQETDSRVNEVPWHQSCVPLFYSLGKVGALKLAKCLQPFSLRMLSHDAVSQRWIEGWHVSLFLGFGSSWCNWKLWNEWGWKGTEEGLDMFGQESGVECWSVTRVSMCFLRCLRLDEFSDGALRHGEWPQRQRSSPHPLRRLIRPPGAAQPRPRTPRGERRRR